MYMFTSEIEVGIYHRTLFNSGNSKAFSQTPQTCLNPNMNDTGLDEPLVR